MTFPMIPTLAIGIHAQRDRHYMSPMRCEQIVERCRARVATVALLWLIRFQLV